MTALRPTARVVRANPPRATSPGQLPAHGGLGLLDASCGVLGFRQRSPARQRPPARRASSGRQVLQPGSVLGPGSVLEPGSVLQPGNVLGPAGTLGLGGIVLLGSWAGPDVRRLRNWTRLVPGREPLVAPARLPEPWLGLRVVRSTGKLHTADWVLVPDWVFVPAWLFMPAQLFMPAWVFVPAWLFTPAWLFMPAQLFMPACVRSRTGLAGRASLADRASFAPPGGLRPTVGRVASPGISSLGQASSGAVMGRHREHRDRREHP